LKEFNFFFKKEVSPAFISKATMKFSFQFMLLTELATLPTKSNLLHSLIVSEFRDTGKASMTDLEFRFQPNVISPAPASERYVSLGTDKPGPRASLAVLLIPFPVSPPRRPAPAHPLVFEGV
jgi:hypothetical protein